MRLAATGLALSAALLAAGGGGCTRGPKPVHVTSVRVAGGSVSDPLREAGLDGAALEALTLAALQGAGFRAGAGDRAYRARVDVLGVRLGAPERGAEGPRVEVAVEIALTPEEGKQGAVLRDTGSGVASVGAQGPGEAFRQAVAAAARDAAGGLALGIAAEAKPVEQVLADLASADPRVRDHAVRALAERRSPEAVPALVERLEDSDPDVVQRAVGALAQIGDRRAVAPLIDLAQRSEPEVALRMVRVIGDVGGAEAEGYLMTLESGASDRQVRRVAREALRDLRARGDGTAIARDR
ncbi:MAG: HEAT repeat domain-containing protein [Anaeromyxobacteraceae bacterium]